MRSRPPSFPNTPSQPLRQHPPCQLSIAAGSAGARASATRDVRDQLGLLLQLGIFDPRPGGTRGLTDRPS